jgi:hypothetical protein
MAAVTDTHGEKQRRKRACMRERERGEDRGERRATAFLSSPQGSIGGGNPCGDRQRPQRYRAA